MTSNEMTCIRDQRIGRREVATDTPLYDIDVVEGFSTASEGQEIIEELLDAMSHRSYPDRDMFAVHLALEEALANAIRHGNQHDPTRRVRVDYEISDRRLLVTVADQGAGFDPNQVPDPTLPENLNNTVGRGLMLMREFMTWIRFNDRGNQVTMCMVRS